MRTTRVSHARYGCGDISPVTSLGRIAGAMLMFLGIGLVGMLTAAMAAQFVEEDEVELKTDIGRLHDRIDGLLQTPARPPPHNSCLNRFAAAPTTALDAEGVPRPG
ncbi:MAG: ion channel [Acidimicrobiia bacterium]